MNGEESIMFLSFKSQVYVIYLQRLVKIQQFCFFNETDLKLSPFKRLLVKVTEC